MHQLSFQYILNYVASHLLTVRERERERLAVHMHGIVIITIKNSYYQELVSHPMPKHADKLNSLDNETSIIS